YYAMINAIAEARMKATDVDTINAWGPGHRQIDAAEALQLQNVFGTHLKNMGATSIKGAIGNALGAAGAIQVASAAIGLKLQNITPTVNWEVKDPSCPLNLFAKATPLPHRRTLVNAHGISGSNSALILSQ
ncbi:MAG TPA: hypothetical protein PLN52_23805, partial [Opitutaceae bacterium]|nr:hypothetical protein [Opitutaceae bacterium]